MRQIVPVGLAAIAAMTVVCLIPAVHGQAANSRLVSPENLARVSDHSWVIKGFPNIGIVVGSQATLVIDTGLGTRNGQIVAETALRLTPKGNKLYLTTTHYHAEHAAGDGGFPPGTIVIRPKSQQAELESEGQKLVDLFSSRSEQDKELLKDYRARPANILFDKSYKLDLGGGVTVRLDWFGAAHTKTDELILVEPDSVLFSGDVVQNKTGPYFYCADCTPQSWLAVLDHIAQLKPKIVVPDHSAPGDGSLIASEQALMSDLVARTKALKAEGKSADQAEHMLAPEIRAKYEGWTGLGRLEDAIGRAYVDTNNSAP
jgi:glyoxylase-like metal-dependent hydrolase (beta-lactamase superfamily II)